MLIIRKEALQEKSLEAVFLILDTMKAVLVTFAALLLLQATTCSGEDVVLHTSSKEEDYRRLNYEYLTSYHNVFKQNEKINNFFKL
ncbi:hypothetical protein J437_LFUL006831, partial [Ladona fulva]